MPDAPETGIGFQRRFMVCVPLWMIFSVNDGLIVISVQRYFPSPLLSIIVLIQFCTTSWVS